MAGARVTSVQCQICSADSELFLCNQCVKALRDMLKNMPEWVDHLTDVMLRQTRTGTGGRRTKTDEFPALYDPGDTQHGKPTKQEQARTQIDDTRTTLATWVRHSCELRGVGFQPPQSVGPQFIGPLAEGWRRIPPDYVPTLNELCAWLHHHVQALACDAAAGEFFRDIGRLVRVIDRIINRPPQPRLCGRCTKLIDGKRCEMKIYARPGAIEATCPNPKCRTVHNAERLYETNVNETEYMLFTKEDLIGNQRTNGDMYSEGMMGERGEFVNWRTFDRWVKDKKLVPQRWERVSAHGRLVVGMQRRNADDKPLYRLSDVRQLRRKQTQRKVNA